MANQVDILSALVEAKKPLSIDEIMVRLPHPSASKTSRRHIIKALGKLMDKKLAQRADAKTFNEGQRRNWHGEQPLYQSTDAALGFKPYKSLVLGSKKRNGPPRIIADTKRQKYWTALRIAGKATLVDLVETASRRGDDPAKAIGNARKYLKALAKAGVAAVLPLRAKGHAPTSNGFLRFAIVRDLGPLAPIVRHKGVFDPNTRETIPYAEGGR